MEDDPEAPKTTLVQKVVNDRGGKPHRLLTREYPLSRAKKNLKNAQKHQPLFMALPLSPQKTTPSLFKKRRTEIPYLFLNPHQASRGWRVIFGSFDFKKHLHGALLLDDQGHLVHTWEIHEDDLDWEISTPPSRKFPHGFVLFKDGSLAFVFDGGRSIQRFDWCSQRIWATQSRTDHSLEKDAQGGLWTVGYPDTVARYDSKSGHLLKKLSLKKVMKKNLKIDPLGIRQKDRARSSTWIRGGGSYFHLNDADPLPQSLDKAFPQFNQGDLLISARSLNLIFVLDPNSQKIKWWRSGGWRRQHDPDWNATGTITLYNNNMHRQTSSIIEINPTLYTQHELFDGSKGQFYSWMRGKHQLLPNGHLLITSPQQGRIFEVNQKGEIVFEFLNVYEQTHKVNILVSEGKWLDLNYFDFDPLHPPSCLKSLSTDP